MPSAVRQRAQSPDAERLVKRQKANHESEEGYAACFAEGVLDKAAIEKLNSDYRQSNPFLHAVVEQLFQDDLLTKVKDECIEELSFTEKQTDIYRVYQTGDLASLSYLTDEQIALLPNLLRLRDALYSSEFRSFIRKVTGCGPLSGKQQDMSVNSYKKGCHLLNHDDVIGTRRVSYILYMPLPKEKTWRREWGGALELYPVKIGNGNVEEPEVVPSKIVPPSWNQFVFFEVQPGHSFHSVEEVVVDEGDHHRQRLSISGWFHKPQKDEEGYEEGESGRMKSSLEQLTSSSTSYENYQDNDEKSSDSVATLSEEQISFLSAFIDPVYLRPDVLDQMCRNFIKESTLELNNFLCEPIAARLETALRARDKADGLDGESRWGSVPAHNAGAEGDHAWSIRGPPHRLRYCTLPQNIHAAKNEQAALETLSSIRSNGEDILGVLQNTLFPSLAFRSWLELAARVITTGYNVEARRFRPGLDYTLATSNDDESILDVVLHLSPETIEDAKPEADIKGKARADDPSDSDEEEDPVGWAKGEWGGWECYMNPHEGDEDPAVYRSGVKRTGSGSNNGTSENGRHGITQQNGDAEPSETGSDDEEGDDGTLLTVQPGFNKLSIVLRERAVLRFTKYVSASAPGSRWDVSGEYTVSVPDDESESGESDEEDGDGIGEEDEDME